MPTNDDTAAPATERRNRVSADNGGALRINPGPGLPQDPTALTTQQLLRENFWLREVLEADQANLATRLDAANEAVKLLQAFADRTPTTMDVQHEVVALREVTFEKFSAIEEQFVQLAIQTDKAALAVKEAVKDAFAAAKEVVAQQNISNALSTDKSEKAIGKQIDGLIDQIKSIVKMMDDKFTDIKDRIIVIESKTSVSDPSTAIMLAKLEDKFLRLSSIADTGAGGAAGRAAVWAMLLGGAGFLFSLILAVAAVVKMVR